MALGVGLDRAPGRGLELCVMPYLTTDSNKRKRSGDGAYVRGNGRPGLAKLGRAEHRPR